MDSQPYRPSPRTSRVVRVFISSTFRDMQAERDFLVKQVFPELRRRCRERAVEFVEVDLRWGVTEEQAERGEVLPICLREIELCRPYFIGLLGERYGWVPEQIEPQLMEEQPWLAEHREHSVTALEIVHGVLGNPEMASRAFFYFRDTTYIKALPPESRADFLSEDPTARAKLERLKERIRLSRLPLKENYPDPETVGKLILEDLWGAIDQEYPPGEVPDPLDREAQEHEAFAASRAKVYIGRQGYFDRLSRHVESEDPPLVLLGESGVGKSALLANWVGQYRGKHPDDFVFFHFIGATPQGTDYVALLHRLISEIKRRIGDPEEVPVQPDKLREALPLWLAKAAARGRMVLVLDALNQLEDKDHAPDLGWLPEYFPPDIRVILSTLPGRSLTTLEKRGWPTFMVAGLEPAEMQQVVQEYLGIYRKTLDARLIREILAAPQAANPMYLRALLEEMRVFGVFEELRNRLRHYLTAPDPPALYNLILARLEQDYEKPRPGLVQEAMSLLWAARRGLSESELLELLGTAAGSLPRAYWSPLALALEDSLVSRSGLLTFFHDYLRQAVKGRYLPTPEAQQAAHLRLADYFEARELDERKVDEFPWQLEKAGAWERLKECIGDLVLFLLLEKKNPFELTGYWLSLKNRYEMDQVYQIALHQFEQTTPPPETLSAIIVKVACFLGLNARYDAAISLGSRALAILDRAVGPEHLAFAGSLYDLAEFYYHKGRFEEAESSYLKALNIFEKSLGPDHLQVGRCLNALGLLYVYWGRFAEAEPLYRRSLPIDEKWLGPESLNVATQLSNLGMLYTNLGNFKEAEPLFRRSLSIREKQFGATHTALAETFSNLGWLCASQARHQEAEHYYLGTLSIYETLLGPEHPLTALAYNNLGTLYQAQGRFDQAETMFRQAIRIWKMQPGSDPVNQAIGLSNLASLYGSKGRFPEAETLFKEALEIDEALFGPDNPNLANTLNNLADLYGMTGRYAEAESLLIRARNIWERSLSPGHPKLGSALNNLAFCYRAQGRSAEAEPLYRQALEIWEQALGPDHPDVAICLMNLSVVFHDQGRTTDAEPLCLRALKINENAFGPEHPEIAKSLNQLGTVLQAKGDAEGAEAALRRALNIAEKAYGPEHPRVATIQNNLGVLYYSLGQLAQAESLVRSSLAARRRILGEKHPEVATGLHNLADICKSLGRLSEAESLFRQAYERFEKFLGKTHPTSVQCLFDLADLLKSEENYVEACKVFREILSVIEPCTAQMFAPSLGLLWAAISHNEMAHFSEVPARNWPSAEEHYRRALELFQQLGQNIEVANVELNLQTLFRLSGQAMDIGRVKELTRLLEEAGDQRAEMGRKLLAKIGQTA